MAKRAKPQPEVLDMVVASPEETEVATAGAQVLAFFKGVGVFLATAGALEKRAKAGLEEARLWQLPTSAREDAQMQRNVLNAADELKEVSGHWNPVTTSISRLHKTLTGARGRTTDMIEERHKLANSLHSQYVKAEERRVAAENERRRVDEENRQQAKRDEEARNAEAEAVKREAASPELSDREQGFVERVFAGVGPRQAAQAVGFKSPRFERAIREHVALGGMLEIEAKRLVH